MAESLRKMTTRELHNKLGEMITADPNNPVWDDPIILMDTGPAVSVELTDVTDECDGSCENPQCIYAVTDPDLVQQFEDESKPLPIGYADEGLHFQVVVWASGK